MESPNQTDRLEAIDVVTGEVPTGIKNALRGCQFRGVNKPLVGLQHNDQIGLHGGLTEVHNARNRSFHDRSNRGTDWCRSLNKVASHGLLVKSTAWQAARCASAILTGSKRSAALCRIVSA